MSSVRLLLVSTVPATMLHFFVPYAAHFRAQGWHVDCATGPALPQEAAILKSAFDQAWMIPWNRRLAAPGNWSQAPLVLRRHLLRQRYDLVHTHTPIASLVTRLVVRSLPASLRPKVVYTAHGFHFHPGGSTARNRIYAAAEKVAGRWTDLLLVINSIDLHTAGQLKIVPSDRVVQVAGVGLDLDHYRPTPTLLTAAARVRDDLAVPAGAPLFSVIAELQPGKNHLTVVRALATDPDLGGILACAGAGPMRDAIVAEAARLGVLDRLRMLGPVVDIRPLVLASTATVLASEREGLSRAVLESLALGVPVVGSRVRGIADVVTGPAGYLAEPSDVAGFAEGMRQAVASPPPAVLREVLDPALQPFSLACVLAVHRSLYASLLADAAAAAQRATPEAGRWSLRRAASR